jgi:hypothetical protein
MIEIEKTNALKATNKEGKPVYVWLEREESGLITIRSDKEPHTKNPYGDGHIFTSGKIWITNSGSFKIDDK